MFLFQSLEGIFILLFFGLFFAMAISWIAFGRLTMARIEREMKRDGLERPCPWDGPGARILWYAFAIALPLYWANRTDDGLIDVPLVRRYATHADVIRGRALLISGYTLAAIGLTGAFYFDIV